MRAPVVRAAILTLAFVLGMGRVGHAQLVVHDPAVVGVHQEHPARL